MARRPKISLDPARAVAYLRVSTEDQALGPEAQRTAIERYAEQQGLLIVEWHLDQGVSGSLPAEQRLGLSSAIASLSKLNAGRLLIAKRDRLARDLVIAASTTRIVEQLGARIESADGMNEDSAEGDFLRGMVDLLAQHERAVIRRRTREALDVKRRRGEKLGGDTPYGFRTEDGKLVPEPAEQGVLARIEALAASESPRSIARVLNTEGVPSRGRRWHPTSIARLLARKPAPERLPAPPTNPR